MYITFRIRRCVVDSVERRCNRDFVRNVAAVYHDHRYQSVTAEWKQYRRPTGGSGLSAGTNPGCG